jgi:hypothetical protein
MDPEELKAFMEELSQRMQAIGETVSEERIKEIVENQFKLLVDDQEFMRKFKFSGDDGEEPKLVGTKYARFGLSLGDVEWLYDLQTSLEGQRRVKQSGLHEGPSEMLRNTFAAISDACYLTDEEIRAIDQKAIDDLFPRLPLNVFRGPDYDLAKRGAFELTGAYQRAIRAMDTAESGYGSQLVGAQYVGDLWEAARKESRIFNLLQTFEMTSPTAYLPVEVGFPEMLFVSESTASDSSNFATSKTSSNRVAVSVAKFVIHQMWSGEMEEDSILPFVPFLRRQQQIALAYYSDSAVLNGDTTNAGTGNINLDDADPSDTKHYLAFDGIRHAAIVDYNTNLINQAGAKTNFNDLVNMRGYLMDDTYKHDWGHPNLPDDLIYTCDVQTGDQVALLDEFVTVDKMGQQATVLTGQQGRIGMHPLIPSIAMSKTEADGKVSTTGSNNTLGQMALFNRRGMVVGWRRRIRVESERLIGSDQTRMVASLRMGLGRFTPTGAASGIRWAAVMRNIGL